MFDFLLQACCVFLTCVGFVQIIAWLSVWREAKHAVVMRIFPLGQADAGKQMSAMYACLQWESKPARDIFVLYDVGLTEQGIRDCETLADSVGVTFVRRGELEKFLTPTVWQSDENEDA